MIDENANKSINQSLEEFSVEFLSQNSGFFIKNLEIKDIDSTNILREFKSEEYVSILQTAIKIGLLTLRNAHTVDQVDYIEKSFDSFRNHMTEHFNSIKNDIQLLFGDNGTIQGLFDLDNKKSLANKFVDEFTLQLNELLDINGDSSSLGILKKEIQANISDLRDLLNQYVGKKSEREKGTLKGFDFENDLEDFLEKYAKIYGDNVEIVGDIAEGRSKKGDLLIKIYDDRLKEPLHIVIEAKTESKISMDGTDGLLAQVKQSIENRNADFGIGVVKDIDVLPMKIGAFRFFAFDKINICGIGDDGLPLELAYKYAREFIINKNLQNIRDNEIKIDEIEGIFNSIANKLKEISKIKSNLTQIDKITKNVKESLDNLKKELIELVNQGINELAVEQVENVEKLEYDDNNDKNQL